MIKYMWLAVLTTSLAFANTDKPLSSISQQVHHELVMLPYLGAFDHLSYRVEGNSVILAGQVTRPTLKTAAERVVKRIHGVGKVDNQIEVLPLSSHDDHLRHALYRAIYGYGPLNRYSLPPNKPIRIIVKNGNVTLEGVVDNQADKNTAYIRARGVHGVFSVANNLRVGE